MMKIGTMLFAYALALGTLLVVGAPTAQADDCTGILDAGGCTDHFDGSDYNCVVYFDSGVAAGQITAEVGCVHVVR